ncbi:hypothetical protein HPB52_005985 [Rhipicephalus sanguineus]|uniref:N-CoR GPS2-interacting domain-containing protein n=1 Tax=Rhipicephalus sanguineus TaxID=34632 RepID=A0A9D4PUL6_RHISA|nr:hypothetical protein HPB52_005985 [Rhipicephalus sanguineus]
MSKVKTLPAGHLYAAQPAPHHHHQHLALGHDAGSPYKRAGPLSPPLAGTRGYPYPQDPTRTHFSPLLNSTQQSYRDAFQLASCDDRRLVFMRRYLEAYRFPHYEQRDMGGGLVGLVGGPPGGSAAAAVAGAAGGLVEPLEVVHLNKRPRLALQQPLLIDTSSPHHHHPSSSSSHLSSQHHLMGGVEVKKEPAAYVPQTEAISPTLPGEDGRPPLSPQGRSSKDDLLSAINRIDREIAQVESQTNKLRKKQYQS